jgi:AraC-like DNA-binding protein
MIDFARARLDEPLSLTRVARHVNLSPSRASHLFVEQVGLPLKTYILWLRLQKAVQRYSEGATLTDAAHGAGFADSAHLSRTFRRMFGLPATALQVNQCAP